MEMSVEVVTAPDDTKADTKVVAAQADDNKGHMFNSFFERSGLCVARFDHSSRVEEANSDFCRQFGFSPREVRGIMFADLLHPSMREKITEQIGRLVHGQRARFADRIVALRSGDGAFNAELTGLAIHGDGGQVDGVMALVRPEKGEQVSKTVAGRGKKLLTQMDARILEGVAAGITTPQLAATLYLSRGGVEYHVAALLRKLKVTNRAALISKAYSRGIFGVGSWPPKVLPEFVKDADNGSVDRAAS
jgi:PAS domain S-box-containing protein